MTVPPLNAVAHQLCSWADAQAFADRDGWFVTVFSSDGKLLATCGGNICLWDTASGRTRRRIRRASDQRDE